MKLWDKNYTVLQLYNWVHTNVHTTNYTKYLLTAVIAFPEFTNSKNVTNLYCILQIRQMIEFPWNNQSYTSQVLLTIEQKVKMNWLLAD